MFYFAESRFVRSVWLALLLVLACNTWFGDTSVWACPNCREALAGDPAQAGLVRGFYWSILFMLAMPFLILGGLGSYFYWEVCRAKRAAVAEGGGGGTPAAYTASPFAEVEYGAAFEAVEELDACRS